jgi:polysaccharide biosynthesis/export protein
LIKGMRVFSLLKNLFQRPFRNPEMLGRAEEASADSTVGSTASELPQAQRRRWGFINGLRVVFFVILIMTTVMENAIWAEDYKLDQGDVLSISVYGYEELQIEGLPIRPDGKISFPLVGEIQAAGLTPDKLNESLTTALSEYIKHPKVIVNVQQFRTTRVYVLGQVIKPGMYEIVKQHNLLDAIGMAGGYTEKAAKKKIYIIHKNQSDKPITVNLLKLLERGDMTQNIPLEDGDVVYLTGNKKINFARDILPYITAMYQVNEMGE